MAEHTGGYVQRMLPFPQEVMLARPVEQLPRGGALPGGCAYEPKWDGYRSLLFVGEDGCRVQSRRGSDITRSFPDIAAAAVEQLRPKPSWTVSSWSGTRMRSTSLQLAVRRTRLVDLLSKAAPPIQLTPHTTDVAQAQQWLADYAAARVGLEGLVVKGLAQPMHAPERLVLGLLSADGELVVAGSTGQLTPRQREQVVPLLRSPGRDHPWPDELPTGRMGHFGRGKVAVTLVEPTLVVEVSADAAYEHGKWRHVTRFVRTRPDLLPEEVRPPR